MMNPVEEKDDEQKEETEGMAEAGPDVVPSLPDAAITGFLANFKLELTQVCQEIGNLTGKQNELLEKVEEHNEVIQSGPEMSQLIKVMEDMKGGMDRLSKLRHEMTVVHDRSEKLKNRAEKLETFCKSAQKKEDDLVAKMDKPGPSDQL